MKEDSDASDKSIDRVKDFFGHEEGQGDGGLPDKIGRYEIVREIGRGGMGLVYEAMDPELGRKVAVKVLRDGPTERLRREARAAAKLRHPNIVTMYEVGEGFIAMEYVAGPTLAEAMPRLERTERLRVLEAVARAVGYAHTQGIIHRDIKPENVLIEPGGRVVLTDFGLARIPDQLDLTRSGTVLGTPHYMAPEQVRGESRIVGPASDVWALGVLLHELLTDAKPFEGATIPVVYDQIVRVEPPPIAGEAGAIVAKALDKFPERRYLDATSMADDLARLNAGEPVRARSIGTFERRWRRVRRTPTPYALGAGVVIAALVAGALAVHGLRQRREMIDSLREQARVSLDAALALRRAGAMTRMRQFLAPLEAAYGRAVERAPDLAEVEYLMGRMHRALLDEERSLAFQDRALAKDPRFAPALYERGLLLSFRYAREIEAEGPSSAAPELGRQARASLDALLAISPSPVGRQETLLAHGLVAYLRGEHHEARARLEEAVKLDASLEEGWEALAHSVWADRQPSLDDQERASRELEALRTAQIERDQGYVPAIEARGRLFWARGSSRRLRGLDPLQAYGAALDDFTRVIELDPRSPEGWTWRGLVNVYRAIWRTENRADPAVECAAAEKDLSQAIALDRAHVSAWAWRGNGRFYRAVSLVMVGAPPLEAFAAAESDLSEALRLAPGDPEWGRWRGRVRAQYAAVIGRAGRDPLPMFEKAEQDFAAVPRTNDAWMWMWRSEVASERALYLAAHGGDPEPDFATARSHLDRGVALQRHLMELWRHRGLVNWERARYLEKTRSKEARNAYAAAAADLIQATTLNPLLRTTLGETIEIAARKGGDQGR